MPAFITWRSVVVQRRSRGCSGRGALGAPPGPKEMGARGLVRSAAVRSVPTWHGFIFVNKLRSCCNCRDSLPGNAATFSNFSQNLTSGATHTGDTLARPRELFPDTDLAKINLTGGFRLRLQSHSDLVNN